MKDEERPSPRQRVAIVEENNFHAETVFACACACSAAPLRGGCDLTVFARDLRGSREFLAEDLRVVCAWHAFPEFLGRVRASKDPPLFDLVIVNTYPPPGGRDAVELAVSAGRSVLGLVHDIHFFGDPCGAQAALERYGNLWLAHVGVAAPIEARRLPAELLRRLIRFFPVFRFMSAQGIEGDDADNALRVWRRGVALPGTIEFARRDYPTALRLAVETRVPLKIFGRSVDSSNGPEIARLLETERQRLFNEIAVQRVPPGIVSVSLDVSCRDFYQAVDRSRFVAVMTVNQEYLMGKLTGAVTAAISCGVPMLARRDVYAYYSKADPAVFAGSMVPLDTDAPGEGGNGWGSLVRDMPSELYRNFCVEAVHAREMLLEENATAIQRVIGDRLAV